MPQIPIQSVDVWWIGVYSGAKWSKGEDPASKGSQSNLGTKGRPSGERPDFEETSGSSWHRQGFSEGTSTRSTRRGG